MNINNKLFLIEYFGLNSKNIQDLSNISNVDKIYTYINNSPVSWVNGDPDFLQGFTTLSRLVGYLIVSNNSVPSYPYVLYTDTDTYPYIKYVNNILEISTFLGQTTTLSDSVDVGSNIKAIYRLINNSPVSWVNGDPDFLQGFSSLENGQTYLVISKNNTVPYVYYELANSKGLESSLLGTSSIEMLHNSVESILYSEFHLSIIML
jgi:hypothetical protein